MADGMIDISLDLLGSNPEAELYWAWRQIRRHVQQGMTLDDAVKWYGIRGHPDFERWFPVTDGPWGDAALKEQLLREKQT